MKSAIAGLAGALALAGAAEASPAVKGFAEAAVDRTRVDVAGLADADLDIAAFSGVVAVPLGRGFGAELDAAVEHYGGDADSDTVWSPTGHLFFGSERGRVGAFAGVTGGDQAGDDSWGAGLEARLNISPEWRVDAAAGYGVTDGVNDVDQRVGRVEVRYFLGDHTRVDAYGAYVDLRSDLLDTHGTTLGLGIEHQLSGPISVFGRLEHAESDEANLSADSIRIGLRWNFGGGSLRDRDIEDPFSHGLTDLFGGVAQQRFAGLLSTLTVQEEEEEDDGPPIND